MTTTQAVTCFVKVELLNIDGAVIGHARIRVYDRAMREALGATLGPAYDARVILPPPPHADERCPYSLQVRTEP